ncbi:hypothetical protein GH714_005867 [Hevea brasiliensis]|uniref:RNase H type-1 domain-containing protein n=1 Tax=Hevea brasiliensis TaxID=3981 RepID=A0A6A6KDN9_HEVBR|nr:hypothetical protein GH714_005867 [Hevea brasiliensis]
MPISSGVFGVARWKIWNRRNRYLFYNEIIDVVSLSHEILKYASNFGKCYAELGDGLAGPLQIWCHWVLRVPPEQDCLKLNCDGTVCGELWAIYEGLNLVKRKGFGRIGVESISLLAVQCVIGVSSPPHSALPLMGMTSEVSCKTIDHHRKDHLIALEEHRIRYLPRFLHRAHEKDVSKYVQIIGGLEEQNP